MQGPEKTKNQDLQFNSWIILNRFGSDWIYILGIACLAIALVYIYQTGGYVDSSLGSNGNLSLRDYNVWVQAGKNLFAGLNPYTADEILKSGTFSSTLIYLLSAIIPSKSTFFAIMQFLNVFGLVYFLNTFFTGSKKPYVLFFLMLTFSSSREILVNGQTTGILMGIFAYVFSALRSTDLDPKFLLGVKSTAFVFPAISVAFLIDLKPNLLLFPLIALFIYFRNFVVPVIALLIWMFHQILFSYFVGEWLLLAWLDNLNSVTSYELNPTLFGSLGPWQLLTSLELPNELMENGPVLTFIISGLVSIKLAIQQRFHSSMFVAFASNYFYSYFHFYSFFPLLSYLTVIVLTGRSIYLAGFFISSMQFSFNTNIVSVQLASIALLLVLAFAFKFNSIKESAIFGAGWITFFLFKYFVFTSLGTNELLAKSIIIATAVAISCYVGGVKHLRSNSKARQSHS